MIDKGVADFHHQTVPLWYWIANEPGSGISFYRIAVLSVASTAKVQAMRVLQCAGQKTATLGISQKEVIRIWLLGEKEYPEITAALDFLRMNGDDPDLSTLEEILPEIDTRYRNDTMATIVYLTAKNDTTFGLSALIKYNLELISDDVTGILFSHPDAVPTEMFRICLKLSSPMVHQKAVEQLNKRNSLTVQEATELFTDSDAEVRLTSAEFFINNGIQLTDEVLSRALIIPARTGLGVGVSA